MDEVRREAVIRRMLAGKLAVGDAALLLGISERQVWRCRARFVAVGTASPAYRPRASATMRRAGAGSMRFAGTRPRLPCVSPAQ